MDETTTEAPVESGETTIQGVKVDDQGMAVSLPADNKEQATAVQDTVEKTAEKSDTGAEAIPDNDDKLASFAKGQGIEDITELTPREKSLLKAAYDSKVEYTQKRQKASEMEKTMTTMSDESAEQVAESTGQDPEVLKRLQRMEVKDSIRAFWDENPEARQYEQDMAKIAVESGLYGSPEAILKASYAIAQSNNSGGVKSQAKREALEKLAHNQNAAVPTGNAVNGAAMTTATITPRNVDQMVASHDLAWFEKNHDAINKAMAG
jgi:hypothetical protein